VDWGERGASAVRSGVNHEGLLMVERAGREAVAMTRCRAMVDEASKRTDRREASVLHRQRGSLRF
jgi:hypothetical protein